MLTMRVLENSKGAGDKWFTLLNDDDDNSDALHVLVKQIRN
jgi:hypothetical protein